jgi:hypothetical protein
MSNRAVSQTLGRMRGRQRHRAGLLVARNLASSGAQRPPVVKGGDLGGHRRRRAGDIVTTAGGPSGDLFCGHGAHRGLDRRPPPLDQVMDLDRLTCSPSDHARRSSFARRAASWAASSSAIWLHCMSAWLGSSSVGTASAGALIGSSQVQGPDQVPVGEAGPAVVQVAAPPVLARWPSRRGGPVCPPPGRGAGASPAPPRVESVPRPGRVRCRPVARPPAHCAPVAPRRLGYAAPAPRGRRRPRCQGGQRGEQHHCTLGIRTSHRDHLYRGELPGRGTQRLRGGAPRHRFDRPGGCGPPGHTPQPLRAGAPAAPRSRPLGDDVSQRGQQIPRRVRGRRRVHQRGAPLGAAHGPGGARRASSQGNICSSTGKIGSHRPGRSPIVRNTMTSIPPTPRDRSHRLAQRTSTT